MFSAPLSTQWPAARRENERSSDAATRAFETNDALGILSDVFRTTSCEFGSGMLTLRLNNGFCYAAPCSNNSDASMRAFGARVLQALGWHRLEHALARHCRSALSAACAPHQLRAPARALRRVDASAVDLCGCANTDLLCALTLVCSCTTPDITLVSRRERKLWRTDVLVRGALVREADLHCASKWLSVRSALLFALKAALEHRGAPQQ